MKKQSKTIAWIFAVAGALCLGYSIGYGIGYADAMAWGMEKVLPILENMGIYIGPEIFGPN